MSSPKSCPVCDEPSGQVFLVRERVPATQNMLFFDQRAAEAIETGDLRMAFCDGCGFVWNQAVDLDRIHYDEAYENTQLCSPAFEQYAQGLVEHMVLERGVRGCRIVEVGCGKGHFLRRLVEKPDWQNTGVGFDPSYIGPLIDLDGRLRFEKRMYGPAEAGVGADVVICRHVIEHVPDPVRLIRSVRSAVTASPRARVFFETPCVEWILRHQVVWDFAHEHCSYFSAASLTTAFERAGLAVISVRHVFGGQYLWLEAKPAAENPAVSRSPGSIHQLARAYAEADQRLLAAWSRLVADRVGSGRVAIWGAGGKGVTFANLVDRDRQRIACIVDINPRKQGCFLPGTGHPVIGPAQLAAHQIDTVLLTNPNYEAEVRAQLAQADRAVRVVNLMDRHAGPA